MGKYYSLNFSVPVFSEVSKKIKNKNPKRIQREISRQINNITVGTKAQNALKLQHDEFAKKNKQLKKERKEEQKARLFEIKQKRKKKNIEADNK